MKQNKDTVLNSGLIGDVSLVSYKEVFSKVQSYFHNKQLHVYAPSTACRFSSILKDNKKFDS